MRISLRMTGLLAVTLAVLGWTAVHAQTLSGSSIFFGIPLSGTGTAAPTSSAASDAASSAQETRFFTPPATSSTSASGTNVEQATEQFPSGLNFRIAGLGDTGQMIDVPVQSYSWTEAPTGTRTRATLQDFHVIMKENLASPRLFLTSAAGTRLPTVTLTARKPGVDREFLRWTLSDVTVSSFQTVGTTDDLIPVDTLTMSYGKIEFQLTPILADGTAGTSVRNGFDLKTGKSF